MRINLWPFAAVFYTDRFIPERFGAFVVWPFIFIRPKYREDRGLLEHELQHVRQLFKNLFLPFLLLYKFNAKFRLRMELDAYRVQLAHAPSGGDMEALRNLFAGWIATNYRLDITHSEAVRLLN